MAEEPPSVAAAALEQEEPSYVLTGYARLADAPVDARRVAQVMAIVGLALALVAGLAIEGLLRGTNEAPEGAARLRAAGSEGAAPVRAPGRAAVVLIDGLRVDEAHRLASLRRLAEVSAVREIGLSTPTLSRPFYHRALTGVPLEVSGVRSNRFTAHARFDSVFDRVRAEGGQVFFATEGLDWMPRMHGAPGDRVEVGGDGLGAPLDRLLEEFREAAPPALLAVHMIRTDATAHAEGLDSDAHRDALRHADALVDRVAADQEAALFVFSDHGHRDEGGHGGPEPEVARAPLFVRAPGLEASVGDAPVRAEALASTVAAWLGVRRPRQTPGRVPAGLAPDGYQLDAAAADRIALTERSTVEDTRRLLRQRRKWALLFALAAIVMSLGPIKRAYGFDRSVPVAILGWPGLVLLLHGPVLGRPLSLSAIDTRFDHGVRIALIGLLAFSLTFVLARALARGAPHLRAFRAASSIGWSAASCALVTVALVGGALGPWPLSPRTFYLPLLFLGAAAPTLIAAAAVLLIARARSAAVSEG